MPLPQPVVFTGNINSVDQAITGGTAVTGLVERQFVNAQDFMDPTETPFLALVGDGETMVSRKIEWVQSFLVPHQSHLAAPMTDTTTGTIVLAAGDGAKAMVSQLVMFQQDGSNEFAWIKSISSDTLTVDRAAGGSTAATHLNGAVVDFMPAAALENVDTPLSPVARGATEWNTNMLMDYGIQESERAIATKDYEIDGDRYEIDLEKKMKEAFRFFEKQAILGRRSVEAGGVAGNAAAKPSTVGGVLQYTSTIYDLAGAPLSEYALGKMMSDAYGRIDESFIPSRTYVGPFLRWALDSLWNAARYANVKDDTINLVWKQVETSFGPLKFTLSRYMPAGTLLLCNPSVYKKHKYGPTGGWREVPLPASGPYKKGRFTGDYSLSFPQDAARAVIINASTNPGDYDNM